MKLESLTDLLLEELRDLYDAEQQLAKALPKMAEAAFDEQLRDGTNKHLEETKEHIRRLETIFKELNVPAKGKHCHGMEGLLEEAEELLGEEKNADPSVLDAALIAAAQRVEHYEIAGYGCARTYASVLGAKKAASLLDQTLKEEAEQDKRLTALAESTINLDAAEADAEIAKESGE